MSTGHIRVLPRLSLCAPTPTPTLPLPKLPPQRPCTRATAQAGEQTAASHDPGQEHQPHPVSHPLSPRGHLLELPLLSAAQGPGGLGRPSDPCARQAPSPPLHGQSHTAESSPHPAAQSHARTAEPGPRPPPTARLHPPGLAPSWAHRNRTPFHSPAPHPPSGRRGNCEARHPRGPRYRGLGSRLRRRGVREPDEAGATPPRAGLEGSRRDPPLEQTESRRAPPEVPPRASCARFTLALPFPAPHAGPLACCHGDRGARSPSFRRTRRNSISHSAPRGVPAVATDNGPGKGRFFWASCARGFAVVSDPLGAEEQVAARRPAAPGTRERGRRESGRPHRGPAGRGG